MGPLRLTERQRTMEEKADPSKGATEKKKTKKKRKALTLPAEIDKKRNVKHDMERLKKIAKGGAFGAHGTKQMNTLRQELERRRTHQAKNGLAKALKKTKQFEIRKVRRSIKQAEAAGSPQGSPIEQDQGSQVDHDEEGDEEGVKTAKKKPK